VTRLSCPPRSLLGAAGQVMSGRLLRLSLGAAFRPATSRRAPRLRGPRRAAQHDGELTLPSNTQLTVQPFRAVIQNTQDATAGAYVDPNDAAGHPLAVTAQDATQFRRAWWWYVDDSQVAGVASTATTDRAVLEILDGALAASAGAAALPAPDNVAGLGEVLIPPVGQTVTLTPYNPRTGLRHGILPVLATGPPSPATTPPRGRWSGSTGTTRTGACNGGTAPGTAPGAPTNSGRGSRSRPAPPPRPARAGGLGSRRVRAVTGERRPHVHRARHRPTDSSSPSPAYVVTWMSPSPRVTAPADGCSRVRSRDRADRAGPVPVTQQSATCLVPIVTAGHFIRLLFSHTNGGTIPRRPPLCPPH
jgi:hypothetical protein